MSYTGPEDVSAIVADIGSGTTKIGFAGGDIPQAWFPTVYGQTLADAAPTATSAKRYGKGGRYTFQVTPPREPVVLRSPLVDGLIEDWDAVEGLLEYALGDRLMLPSTARAPKAPTGGAGGSATTHASGMSSSSASSSSSSSSSSSASAAAGGGGLADIDMSAHPFLLSEHVYASKADRERWCNLLFEKYKCPGVFMAKAGVLSIYANARTTGLAVDMGAGGTAITPVQDGFPLMMGVRVNPIGGRVLDAELLKALNSTGGKSSSAAGSAASATSPSSMARVQARLPPYPKPAAAPAAAAGASDGDEAMAGSSSSSGGASIGGTVKTSSGAWHSSVVNFLNLELARDIKESVCKALDDTFDPAEHYHTPTAPYELPDGTVLQVGTDRFVVPELMFDPPAALVAAYPGARPLHQSLLEACMACDIDVRRDLVFNTVLVGGASGMEGIAERLLNEWGPIAPAGTRPKIIVAAPQERALGPWLGGSILGSLGSFHDLWFSAAEYAEHGPKMVHRKCP